MTKKKTPQREPHKGELVIITITRVMKYGAVAQLDEYPGVEGFLPIREVSSKWIKNIKDYVRVGQKTVAKVMEYDRNKGVANISLRKVTEEERRKILELHANLKKSRKILEMALKHAKSRQKVEDIEAKILSDYDNIYDFMLDVFDEGKAAAEEMGLSPKLSAALEALVKRSYKPKRIIIKEDLFIEVPGEKGIELIKEALKKAEKYVDGLMYVGAGHFLLEWDGDDYKSMKKRINSAKAAVNTLSKVAARLEFVEHED